MLYEIVANLQNGDSLHHRFALKETAVKYCRFVWNEFPLKSLDVASYKDGKLVKFERKVWGVA